MLADHDNPWVCPDLNEWGICSRAGGCTCRPRPVTRQEDQFLRDAAKASSKIVAPGKLADGVMGSDQCKS